MQSKFAKKVNYNIEKLKNKILKLHNSNIKIACYTAPAKGNTLLNYCNITSNDIPYTVDKNPHKQELFLPGTHIPIHAPEKVQETKPDYLLILPWNLKDEIIQQMSYIRDWGGKFVTLIPDISIIE